MTIGQAIKRVRQNRGYSRKQLAALSHLTSQGIAQIEWGRRHPKWATVQSIAAALGVELSEIARITKEDRNG